MKNVFGTERLVALLKCLMAAYLITGVMLVMVAGFLYKFSIGENVVDISIIVIYCISSFFPRGHRAAGLSGECWREQRIFW